MRASVRSIVLVLAVALVAPTAGATTKTGSISGRVTAADGQPLQGICVAAFAPAWNGVSVGTIPLTDADGRYMIEQLEATTYRIRFTDCNYVGVLTEWYKDKPSFQEATDVAVGSGAVTGIDAALTRMGRIAGRVVSSSGAPLSGICVRATGPGQGIGITGADGRYVTSRLPAGHYTVAFASASCDDEPYLTRWYPDSPTAEGASNITVRNEITTTNINGRLTRSATVSGRISSEDGESLEGCAVAYDSANREVAISSTDPTTGAYRLAKLQGGHHTIFMYDCDGAEHVGEWYEDAWSRQDATPITLALGFDVVGIDAALTLGGVVSGVISDVGGRVLEGICIFRPGEWVYPESHSDRYGRFRMHGLQPGHRTFLFSDCHGGYYYPTEVRREIEAGGTIELEVIMRAGLGPCDPYRDSDGDSVNDCYESELGTDVNKSDSDGDSLSDGEEVYSLGGDPLDVDTDNDLFSDGTEVKGGSCLGREAPPGSDPTDARKTPFWTLQSGPRTLPDTTDPIC